jgi:NAD(P)-dependent dehydrogenase (short-subunit alcohol dehydrogenase family)
VLAVEEPALRVHAVDPGDMDTAMHRAADPTASGLPSPESVVPALLRLVDERPASGRYRAAELVASGVAG